MASEFEKRLNWAKELHQQSMELMDQAIKVTPSSGPGWEEKMQQEKEYIISRAHVRALQAQTQAMLAGLEWENNKR